MAVNLRLILGDQLSHSISSLSDCDKNNDLIFMCKVLEEGTYVRHHKKKIAFLFSAMRHFALELQQKGYKIIYTKLDDPDNAGSFFGEIKRILGKYSVNKVIVTHPGEYRVLKDIESWQKQINIEIEILDDNRFLYTPAKFRDWAKNRSQLRMEYFYRQVRQEFRILMNGDKPLGGKWNYDKSNRKPITTKIKIPSTYQVEPNAITQEVLELVEKRFSDHFGNLHPFNYAISRDQALEALNLFIDERLRFLAIIKTQCLKKTLGYFTLILVFTLTAGYFCRLNVSGLLRRHTLKVSYRLMLSKDLFGKLLAGVNIFMEFIGLKCLNMLCLTF